MLPRALFLSGKWWNNRRSNNRATGPSCFAAVFSNRIECISMFCGEMKLNRLLTHMRLCNFHIADRRWDRNCHTSEPQPTKSGHISFSSYLHPIIKSNLFSVLRASPNALNALGADISWIMYLWCFLQGQRYRFSRRFCHPTCESRRKNRDHTL